MSLGRECSPREDPHKRRREFWDLIDRADKARRA
jgi:hypothetical protein